MRNEHRRLSSGWMGGPVPPAPALHSPSTHSALGCLSLGAICVDPAWRACSSGVLMSVRTSPECFWLRLGTGCRSRAQLGRPWELLLLGLLLAVSVHRAGACFREPFSTSWGGPVAGWLWLCPRPWRPVAACLRATRCSQSLGRVHSVAAPPTARAGAGSELRGSESIPLGLPWWLMLSMMDCVDVPAPGCAEVAWSAPPTPQEAPPLPRG